MLQLKQNSFVKNIHMLESEYEVSEGQIRANVNAGIILDMCLRFLHMNRDKHLYFYLETPEALTREADFSSDSSVKNSTEQFRADFESFEKASGVLFFFSDLLAKDGLCRFKFGTEDGDEIYVEKYNIVTVKSCDTDKYEKLFCDAEIKKTDKLITAYDTFSKQTPGFAKCHVHKGMSVRDIPECMKMYGLIR